uniref:DUF6069 family protein n=1 Tax=Streptomyces sp. CHD11 TaxID=2741325 RepID=UPI0034D3B627
MAPRHRRPRPAQPRPSHGQGARHHSARKPGFSLVPPLLSGATTATTTALLGLHLVPAAVMIPTLTRSLDTRAG